MPTPDNRVKVGHDKHHGEQIDPDDAPLLPHKADSDLLSRCIERYFSGYVERPRAMASCLYTLTVDRDFIIDGHPDHDLMLIFSCCSGHGFKYAPAYGQIALDLIQGTPRPDLGSFEINRCITERPRGLAD